MKRVTTILLLLLVLSLMVSAAQEIKIDKKTGTDKSYKQIKKQTIVGYKTAHKIETNITQVCEFLNTTGPNTDKQGCTSVTHHRAVIDTSKQGEPLYKYEDPEEFEVNGKRIKFDNKRCWTCGDYVACLSKEDGGSNIVDRPEYWKCKDNLPIFRSGETGITMNIDTGSKKQIKGGSHAVDI